jgi:hypothetical protein
MSATKVVMAPRPPKNQDLLEKEEEKTSKNVQQLQQLLTKLESVVEKDPEQCKIEFFNVEYLFYQLPPKLRTQALAKRVEVLQSKMDTSEKHATVSQLNVQQQEDKAFLDMNEEHLFADLKMDEDKSEPIMSKDTFHQPQKNEDQDDLELLQKLEREESDDEKRDTPLERAKDVDKTMSHLIVEPMPIPDKKHESDLKNEHTKKKEKIHTKHAVKERLVAKPIEIKPLTPKAKPVQEEFPIQEDLENVDIPFEPLPEVPKNDAIQKFIDQTAEIDPAEISAAIVKKAAVVQVKTQQKLSEPVQQKSVQSNSTESKHVQEQQRIPIRPIAENAIVQKQELIKKQVLQSEKINFIKPEEVSAGMSSMELYDRGLHFFHQRNYEQALTCFKEVLKIAPNNLAARIRLTEVQEEMNKM